MSAAVGVVAYAHPDLGWNAAAAVAFLGNAGFGVLAAGRAEGGGLAALLCLHIEASLVLVREQ